jgi:glycerol-3-phosphate dehydrogenase
MKIAVVGGGINGLTCAWELAKVGHGVTLFERDGLMQATSRSSSKLLHGGLRYLENGEIRLVFEALSERDKWLERAPHLAKSLSMIYPIFKDGRRSRWIVAIGVWLYKLLSLRSALPSPKWMSKEDIVKRQPQLKTHNLLGGYKFYDGQMDDYNLGLWVAEQCKISGVTILENTEVDTVNIDGTLKTSDGKAYQFEKIINIAGPWAELLLQKSTGGSPIKLDLIRGSHLIVKRSCKQAYLLEVPNERRIFFVLPWQEKTLIGTTEVRQNMDEPIKCSQSESDYLIKAYNHWMVEPIGESDIESTFSGVRPLLTSEDEPSRVTREYVIRKDGKLITVFGGKWTTTCALAKKIMKVVTKD